MVLTMDSDIYQQNLFSLKGKTALVTGASRGLGQALAVGIAQAGADVVCSSSAAGGTDGTQALQEDPARNAEIEKRIPAGKWGKPEQLVGAAIFLANEASDYVNGHVLAVDGGWLAR
jgi:2-deoxy-D-gluconate 3-dehydrogenase